MIAINPNERAVRHLIRCVDAEGPPAAFVGEWLEDGRGYAARIALNHHSHRPVLFLDGVSGDGLWGFHPDRFELLHYDGVPLLPIILN